MVVLITAGVVLAAAASFAFRQWLDYEITIRRRAPSIFGWMTLFPVLGFVAYLYVRWTYPVVDAS